ncbi:methyl-accepting chemotaxis protein [Desulfovibrionales bacterium]
MPDLLPQPETPSLRSTLDAVREGLHPLIPRISTVIKDREEDFLHLGATIFAMNSQAGSFSRTASDMAQSVGQGALKATVSELQQQVNETRTLFTSASSAKHLDDMAAILTRITSLGRAMDQFTRMVRTLKVLEVATRIESAHLGQAGSGFSTLADDVKSLSAKIAQNTDKIREQTQHLQTHIATARGDRQKQIHEQSLHAQEVFTNLSNSIEQLEHMRSGTEALVEELATGSHQVAKSMSQVVASVQFHDITRQQVEHVQEILDLAVEEIIQPSQPEEAGLGAWVRDVLRLQAVQLQQARTMLHQAVEDLITSLQSIAHQIATLCQQITAVAYTGQNQGTSTLDSIGGHIAQIIAAMHTTSDQAQETSLTMTGMAETISTVGEFVDDIEEIGVEIELIALNANVKAAHTGEQGRALSVLAVEIQHLSQEARTQTSDITTTLNTVADMAQEMIRAALSANLATTAVEIQTSFTNILEQLTGLDQTLHADIARLSELGERLVQDLHALTSSIHVHHEVSAEVADLEAGLASLLHTLDPFQEILDEARQPDALRDQLARYTMDSERLIHLAVLGHQDDTGLDTGAELIAGDVDLFDDGLELFDNGVELFDDGVELFEPEDRASNTAVSHPATESTAQADEDEFGDNVELF